MANLLTQPQAFDNAAWTKIAATITANATTGADGTSTADALLETTANSPHYAGQGYVSCVVGQFYMASVAIKANGRNFGWAQITAGGSGWQVAINLTTGALSAPVGFGTPCPATDVSVSAVLVATGLYRIFFKVRCWGAFTLANFGSSTSLAVDSYVGDVTKGIYLWDGWLLQSSRELEMPQPLKCNAKVFDIAKNQLVSPVGSGFVQTINRGPDAWVARYETPVLVSGDTNDQAMQAFLDNLDGNANTFLGFDPRKTKPAAYATSAYAYEPWKTDTTLGSVIQPLVTSVNIFNSTISVTGLVAAAIISRGDMLSYKDANMWRCFRATAATVADGSGNATIAVTPRPTQAIQMAYPALRMTRACAEMKMVGAPQKSDRVSDPGPSYQFSAAQYVNRA